MREDGSFKGYYAHYEEIAPDGAILIKRMYITEDGKILKGKELEDYELQSGEGKQTGTDTNIV